jgi:hypothetical protein
MRWPHLVVLALILLLVGGGFLAKHLDKASGADIPGYITVLR